MTATHGDAPHWFSGLDTYDEGSTQLIRRTRNSDRPPPPLKATGVLEAHANPIEGPTPSNGRAVHFAATNKKRVRPAPGHACRRPPACAVVSQQATAIGKHLEAAT